MLSNKISLSDFYLRRSNSIPTPVCLSVWCSAFCVSFKYASSSAQLLLDSSCLFLLTLYQFIIWLLLVATYDPEKQRNKAAAAAGTSPNILWRKYVLLSCGLISPCLSFLPLFHLLFSLVKAQHLNRFTHHHQQSNTIMFVFGPTSFPEYILEFLFGQTLLNEYIFVLIWSKIL